MKDRDNIPLTLKLKDGATAIDLTDYGFSCELMHGETSVKIYSIAKGATTSTFLAKTNNAEVLDTQAMMEDIQSIATPGLKYRLIVTVTQPDDYEFVYLIFNINAAKY